MVRRHEGDFVLGGTKLTPSILTYPYWQQPPLVMLDLEVVVGQGPESVVAKADDQVWPQPLNLIQQMV